MSHSDAAPHCQNLSKAQWNQLDDDAQARLWAEAHKHDTTKQGAIVLDCRHGSRVGECDLCRRWQELGGKLSRPTRLERVIVNKVQESG